MKIDGNLTATNLIKQGNQLQVKEDSTVKEPVDSAVISSAEFSKIGQLLAKTTFDCGVSVNTASEQRRIQKEGLASMVANSGTTQDEKTLAGLGITFGDHYMYDVSAARTRNVVLQTIIGGIGGAMGSVIAKVTYDAGVAVKTAEEQRFIQKDGLQAIKENPKSSQDEKTIAELGIVFGDSYMNNTSATKARNVVLQTIIGNISGPIGSAIAKVTYDAGVKVETAKEQRAIQKQGLQGIVANSGATKEEKALAELGIEFGDSYMYDTSATKARNVVLNTIKGGINGSIGSVIAKVTYDAGVAVKTAEEQRAIQRQGFEAILANPDTTEEQKLLAQRGIDVGDHYMYDTSAAKARNIILQELFK